MFNNAYSGLITGGLGLPACTGLITMGFHVFSTKIDVVVSKPGTGGFAAHHVGSVPGVKAGSPYIAPTATSRATVGMVSNSGATPGFYTPANRRYGQPQHMVNIMITFSNGRKREKIFLVNKTAIDVAIKLTKLFEATANRVKVAITNLGNVGAQTLTEKQKDEEAGDN